MPNTVLLGYPRIIELISAPAKPSAHRAPAKSPRTDYNGTVRNPDTVQYSNLNHVTAHHSNPQIISAIRALTNSINQCINIRTIT